MRYLLLLLCTVVCAHAEWDHLFSDDEDPALFHHVNVITGNLNLCLQDGVVQGAKPLPLFRTYSSAGALERWKNLRGEPDSYLKFLRKGILVQGGWSFFPHTNLLIELRSTLKETKVYVAEPSGNLLAYSYSHRAGKSDQIWLKPKLSAGQYAGILSARTNPQNNIILLNLKEGTAELQLPDGGKRIYQGKKFRTIPPEEADPGEPVHYYRLVDETLPSQQKIHYDYEGSKKNLSRIAVRGPSGKTFSWIHFHVHQNDTPFHFSVTTSDGKSFDYQALAFKERDYLATLKSSHRPSEISHYAPGRSSIGARMESLERSGQTQFRVSYYLPQNKKEEELWAKKPKKKDYPIDKVSLVEAPLGPNGEMVALGRFSYSKEPKFTDVLDLDGIKTRYFHDGERLSEIHTHDTQGLLVSMTKFHWDNGRLIAKIKCDAGGNPLFAKTFQYDGAGNVVEEALWGDLSGAVQAPFSLNANHTLEGAECLRKRFTYAPQLNLPLTEEEEDGPTIRFNYKSGTDLLTAKLTYDKEQIIKREFFEYDEDHLLIAEIIDDGSGVDPQDLTRVSERQIKRYIRDPTTCLPKTVMELYLDEGKEVLVKKVELTYSPENLVKEEAIFDAEENYRYTLFTSYEKERIVRRTTPLGRENSFRFDDFGNLLESKEVGSPKKSYTYDSAGRPFSCTENGKTSFSTYDAKGRLLVQTDTRGNSTTQIYDAFGRCLQTIFPTANDESGELYQPIARFTYDLHGNLASTTLTGGETTKTFYNILRKPTRIIQADGTEVTHRYNKNGTLCKTIYPDGTEVHYTYDLFQRMTSKTVKSRETLSQEFWEYNAFHLLSHTDTRGLTTRYTYDGAGRKIAEEADGRKKIFSYDALGFLERTSQGDTSHVQICNVEGEVIEQWTEDASGKRENWMRFFYDQEGRKERALRLTSRGDAEDLFVHDTEGRLIRHTDPDGFVTQFLFSEEEKNELGQQVKQKHVIDALGNSSIEVCDALNRPILLEKKDPEGKIVSREELLYDQSGNRAKRITSVFDKHRLTKQIISSWEYDAMGRVVKEIEDGKKITTFTYDLRGRLSTKTLPNGTVLFHTHDGLDRLTELKSSDGTVHFQYTYKEGPEATEIRDLIQQTALRREYNLFGELTHEINPAGLRTHWKYDDQGRVTRLTLPDLSSTLYHYAGNHLRSVERLSSKGEPLYKHDYLHFDENGHVSEESMIHQIGGIRTTRDLLERPIAYTTPWLHHRAEYGATSLVTKTQNSLFGDKSYTYDALNQLEQEGAIPHQFDSIGNPTNCITENCNQISSFEGCTLRYDENGNPVERNNTDNNIQYTYDALGRLTSVTQPNIKRVQYLYDPLSRLLSKETALYKYGKWQKEAVFYLYDQEKEIGTLDAKGKIRELKILGLGIRGEIGAAIAIELQGKTFAPLHDFQGNIIALISPRGEITESYEISAFGKEKTTSEPQNPWRFSSKRTEDGLIFFGKRFYDPSLGRWLTPDPAGFADGPNLYLFVLNSPLNRLDLFGLESESFNVRLEASIDDLKHSSPSQLVPCRIISGETHVDGYISCEHFYKMQFSEEENAAGKVDIFDHFHDIVHKEGALVGVISFENGINNPTERFYENVQSLRNKIPEGTLLIGIYNRTDGMLSDLNRAWREIRGKETPIVSTTRQFLATSIDTLHKYNPDALWLHIVHSEAGAITRRAIEGLLPEQKNLLQQHLYIYALAPAKPIPRNFGFIVSNVYSEEDLSTGWAGWFRSFNKSKYDIRFIPSEASLLNRIRPCYEHGLMNKTYQTELQKQLSDIRRDYGFYNDAVR